MAHSLIYCHQFSCHFWRDVVFDRWSSGKFSHDPRRASRRKALREFLKRSITVTNKSNSLTYTVPCSLVCTSPLAVITVVGFVDILMVSISAELRSFLLTICILAPESTTNYLSSGSFVDATGSTHSSAGEWNIALLLFFELVYVFGRVPCLASGASLLSFSLFLGLVNKNHSVETSLMRIFDCIFPSDGPFFSRILA